MKRTKVTETEDHSFENHWVDECRMYSGYIGQQLVDIKKAQATTANVPDHAEAKTARGRSQK